MNNVVGKKISMFRCQMDPMIGAKPRQAFVPEDLGAEAYLMAEGVYIKLANGNEHLVPFANVQSVRFAKEEVIELKTKKLKSEAI